MFKLVLKLIRQEGFYNKLDVILCLQGKISTLFQLLIKKIVHAILRSELIIMEWSKHMQFDRHLMLY